MTRTESDRPEWGGAYFAPRPAGSVIAAPETKDSAPSGGVEHVGDLMVA